MNSEPGEQSTEPMQPAASPFRQLFKSILNYRVPRAAYYALTWHAVSAVIGLGVAVLLILVAPFDLDEGIGEQGRAAFFKIAGFAYPERLSPKTLAVLLDERYLQEQREAWPAPYEVHAAAIESIASRGARAIFIDFLFVDERRDPSLQYFIDTIARISEETPIYIATGRREDLGRNVRAELEALARRASGVRLVSTQLDDPIGGSATYRTARDSDGLRPAAVALYQDFCASPNACAPRPEGQRMDIWWGVRRTDEFNCRGEELERLCGRLPQGWLTRGISLTTGAVSGLLDADWKPVDPVPLPYAPTITLSDLFNGALAPTVSDRVRGAVVFYGAALAVGGDDQYSPVLGRLSGVHVHAMAYDNLVVLQGRYIRADPSFKPARTPHLIALTAILASASLMMRIVLTLSFPRMFQWPQRHAKFFGAIDAVVFLIGAALIAWIEFSFLRVGPAAWAPVFVAAAAGDFLAMRPLTRPIVNLLTAKSAAEPNCSATGVTEQPRIRKR